MPTPSIGPLKKNFWHPAQPSGLTLMHVTGVGSGNETGVGRFAHKGLVRRVIGGHWLWSKNMGQLALDEEIEAYNLPQGVLSLLTREIAAGRPGLLTTVGMTHLYRSPHQGGRLNKSARSLWWSWSHFRAARCSFTRPFPSMSPLSADPRPTKTAIYPRNSKRVDLDILSSAQAAYNSGGTVIAQVKRIVKRQNLESREWCACRATWWLPWFMTPASGRHPIQNTTRPSAVPIRCPWMPSRPWNSASANSWPAVRLWS